MPTPFELLVADDNHDLLTAFFCALSSREVCKFSAVCKTWARAAEANLESTCRRHRWQQPRRARLVKASSLGLAWRPVFLNKVCRACFNAPGDFAVRTVDAGAPRCFLCARCAKKPQIVQRLQRHSLTLDVTGLSGRPLYNGKESKFAAEVSMLSKDALDNASGARAEVLRHSGNGRRR